MINYKHILAATTALLLPAVVRAEGCDTVPSCAALGFAQTVSECGNRKMLKCPFDNTKAFCGVRCNTGELYFDGACRKIHASCAAAGYIEESQVNNQDCSSADAIIYTKSGTKLSCYAGSCYQSNTSSGGSSSGGSSSGDDSQDNTSSGGTCYSIDESCYNSCIKGSDSGYCEMTCERSYQCKLSVPELQMLALKTKPSMRNITAEECYDKYAKQLALLDNDFAIYEDETVL